MNKKNIFLVVVVLAGLMNSSLHAAQGDDILYDDGEAFGFDVGEDERLQDSQHGRASTAESTGARALKLQREEEDLQFARRLQAEEEANQTRRVAYERQREQQRRAYEQQERDDIRRAEEHFAHLEDARRAMTKARGGGASGGAAAVELQAGQRVVVVPMHFDKRAKAWKLITANDRFFREKRKDGDTVNALFHNIMTHQVGNGIAETGRKLIKQFGDEIVVFVEVNFKEKLYDTPYRRGFNWYRAKGHDLDAGRQFAAGPLTGGASVATGHGGTIGATATHAGVPHTGQWGIGGAKLKGKTGLYFYTYGKPYYEFTNFYEASFDLDGQTWKTAEHYFQVQKLKGTAEYAKALAAKTPREAFGIAQKAFAQFHDSAKQAWLARKKRVMYDAVYAKFSQNPGLKAKLLATGDAVLVENAGPKDKYWGAGADMNGYNDLGLVLMQVRAALGGSPY